eukprot:GHVQ01008360.1.p1 GENE.GHVQ01008360.1~~GHVQ01008360.1.p1  ORF type:complete len:323 (-),score=44.91 GHVQ01008360.1:989-1957(-)
MSSPVNMHHNSRPSQPSARRLLRQQPFGLLRARNHIPGSPRIPSLCQERYEEEDVSVQRSLMRYQGTVAARKGCEIWTWGTTCLLFFNSSSRRKLDWYLKWLPDCYEVRMLALIISLAVCGFLLWTIRYWFRKMMDPKKHLKAEKARKQLEDISKKQVEDSQAYEQAWNQAAKLTEQAAEKLLSMTQRQVSPTSLDLPHGSAVPGLEQQHAVVVELLEKVRTKLRNMGTQVKLAPLETEWEVSAEGIAQSPELQENLAKCQANAAALAKFPDALATLDATVSGLLADLATCQANAAVLAKFPEIMGILRGYCLPNVDTKKPL